MSESTWNDPAVRAAVRETVRATERAENEARVRQAAAERRARLDRYVAWLDAEDGK